MQGPVRLYEGGVAGHVDGSVPGTTPGAVGLGDRLALHGTCASGESGRPRVGGSDGLGDLQEPDQLQAVKALGARLVAVHLRQAGEDGRVGGSIEATRPGRRLIDTCGRASSAAGQVTVVLP
jgi:hypothetical protein